MKLEWSIEGRTCISKLISSTLIESEGQTLCECNLSKDGAVCKFILHICTNMFISQVAKRNIWQNALSVKCKWEMLILTLVLSLWSEFVNRHL